MTHYRNRLLIPIAGIVLLCASVSFPIWAGAQEKPTTLSFIYTGDTCSAWSNVQSTEAYCLDYGVSTDEARIVAFDPLAPTTVWFDDTVQRYSEFTVDALNAETFVLTGQSVAIQIFDPYGVLLQEVEIGIDDPLLLQWHDVYGGVSLKKTSYRSKIPGDYIANQYIVGFGDGVTQKAIKSYEKYWKNYGVNVLMKLPLVNALVMQVPESITASDLANDPGVTTVKMNQIIAAGHPLNAQGQSFIRPHKRGNREKYEYPWSIAKLFGQSYDYESAQASTVTVDKDRLPNIVRLAMEAVKNSDLRIAVFDTGIADTHDRASKVEYGFKLVMSDGSYVFYEGKPGDDNGHGTHVGGILAALLDKDLELGKRAPITLYAVKMLDQYATGSLSNIIMGLQWAIANGTDIVNMSLGYKSDDPLVRKAIQEASRAGIIMVASAGNRSNYDDSVLLNGSSEGGSAEGGSAEGGSAEGGSAEGGSAEGGSAEGGSAEGGSAEGGSAEGGSAEGGSAEGGSAGSGFAESLPLYSVMYPARYPEVIAVGASNRWGEIAAFSNWGPEMDVMAPGVDIFSWDITNGDIEKGYGSTSGTSMAAPHVTAAVAMIMALDPSLDVYQIRQILRQTADDTLDAPAGNINLIAALNEVVARLIGDDPSIFDYSTLKDLYEDAIEAKLASVP